MLAWALIAGRLVDKNVKWFFIGAMVGAKKGTVKKIHPFILMLITVSLLLVFLDYSLDWAFSDQGGFILGTRSIRAEYEVEDVLVKYIEKKSQSNKVQAQYPFFDIESVDTIIQEWIDNQIEKGLNNTEFDTYLIDYRIGLNNEKVLSLALLTPEGNQGFVFTKENNEQVRISDWLKDENLVLDFVRFSGKDMYLELTDNSSSFYITKDYGVEFYNSESIKRVELFELDSIFGNIIKEIIPDYDDRLMEYDNQLNQKRLNSREVYINNLLNYQSDIDCNESKCVALTFDGGPNEQMQAIIETLDTEKAKGTFYVIGKDIFNKSEIFLKSLNRGHEIGNATWSHPDLATLSDEEILQEYEKNQEIIWNLGGIWSPTFRPPFGSFDETKSQLIDSRIIKWDVDSRDWELENPQEIADLVLSQIKPGDTVLMHSLNQSTVNSLPIIIQELRSQGYEFVTVSKLLDLDKTE